MGITVNELRQLGFARQSPSVGVRVRYGAVRKDSAVQYVEVGDGKLTVLVTKPVVDVAILSSDFNILLRHLVKIKHSEAVIYMRSSKIDSIFEDEPEDQKTLTDGNNPDS